MLVTENFCLKPPRAEISWAAYYAWFLAIFAFLAAVFIVVVGGAWLVSEFGPQRAARIVESRTGFAPEWERLQVRPLAGRLTLENGSLRHSLWARCCAGSAPASSLGDFSEARSVAVDSVIEAEGCHDLSGRPVPRSSQNSRRAGVA